MDGFALDNDYGTWGEVFKSNNTFRFDLDLGLLTLQQNLKAPYQP